MNKTMLKKSIDFKNRANRVVAFRNKGFNSPKTPTVKPMGSHSVGTVLEMGHNLKCYEIYSD